MKKVPDNYEESMQSEEEKPINNIQSMIIILQYVTQVIIALKVIKMKTKYDTELLTSKERQSTLVCKNKKQLQTLVRYCKG